MGGRTKKAVLNIGSNLFLQIFKTIFTFITRTVFIYCLGKEALGLNGLFTNVLSMLSLAELGIGTAINFSLYEPIAKKNNDKISSLMTFYKKAYRIIGLLVFTLGIILIPFLKYLIHDFNKIDNALVIYLLFLLNTVSSYFISYKETLINADQNSYKLTFINTFFLLFLNILQIISLLIFKDFVLYLIIQFLIQFIQKIIINVYISKKYSYINFNSKRKIQNDDFKMILKNVKAMFFHKIGDYCINGTDNLIISAFISISMVGLYSNYLTVITLLSSFALLFFNSLTASLGNLVVTESLDKKYDIFKKINFIAFMMYGFCSVILINVFNDFISLWIGNEYCLSFGIVLVMIINFYITGMRVAPHTLKSASGMYDVDKFTPLIQSVINLFFSILLVKYIGLLGVILGTLISSLILPTWQRPYIVYKYILKKPFKEYLFDYFKYLLVVALVSVISLFINNFCIKIEIYYLAFLIKFIDTLLVYSVLITLFYKKTEEFNYLFDIVKKIILRREKI